MYNQVSFKIAKAMAINRLQNDSNFIKCKTPEH